MAVKRGKSQARRNNGSSNGLPGWAWLVLGIVLTLVVILVAPRWLKSDAGDGFIRPRPNPDAQPQASRGEDDEGVVPAPAANANDGAAPAAAKADDRKYDFYTLLPGQEVAMSDAELAASARAEQDRQRKLAEQQANAAAAAKTAQADPAAPSATTPAAPTAATPPPATAPATTPATTAPTAVAAADSQARYILQAGAFGASGDAESLKARIALLGLNARVESAAIGGKTVYRVRMGPYGTATELTDAKRKLANGGLPAMAVKAR